jgi:hypothetical protein
MFSLATSESFAIGHLIVLYKRTDSVYFRTVTMFTDKHLHVSKFMFHKIAHTNSRAPTITAIKPEPKEYIRRLSHC